MTTQVIMGLLGASHTLAVLIGWFVGHYGFKHAVAVAQSIPSTVVADVNILKTDVTALKAKLP